MIIACSASSSVSLVNMHLLMQADDNQVPWSVVFSTSFILWFSILKWLHTDPLIMESTNSVEKVPLIVQGIEKVVPFYTQIQYTANNMTEWHKK